MVSEARVCHLPAFVCSIATVRRVKVVHTAQVVLRIIVRLD